MMNNYFFSDRVFSWPLFCQRDEVTLERACCFIPSNRLTSTSCRSFSIQCVCLCGSFLCCFILQAFFCLGILFPAAVKVCYCSFSSIFPPFFILFLYGNTEKRNDTGVSKRLAIHPTNTHTHCEWKDLSLPVGRHGQWRLSIYAGRAGKVEMYYS